MTTKQFAVGAVAVLLASMANFVAVEANAADGDNDRFGNGGEKVEGGRKGKNLSASAMKITWDHSKNYKGGGEISSVDANWSPPPCWYAPRFTPKQFKAFVAKYERSPHHTGKGQAMKWYAEKYGKDSEYEDYNIAKQGDGMWWDSYINPNTKDHAAALTCDRPYFWVPDGEIPDDPQAISPEVLAELAYEQIRVPDTAVELNPDDKQTVNLATWAWLDKATFKPVSVTAAVDDLNISATTTATPVALKLEAGTEDAELHPSSGECPINTDGSIGKPYAKGDTDKIPPCGLTYLRATSGKAPYELKATITWEVAWAGTGSVDGELPSGTFGTEQDVTVQEAQSVVR